MNESLESNLTNGQMWMRLVYMMLSDAAIGI